MLLIAGTALIVAVGLAVATVLALTPSAAPSGVARSLELARRPLPTSPVPLAEQPARTRIGRPVVAALVRLGKRITPAGTPERLRRRADLAGNTFPWDLQTQVDAKAAGTVVLGSLGLAVAVLGRSASSILLGAVLGAAGYWLPDILLYNAGTKRQEALRRAAPDALDMLTICVEAGLGFDAALRQVAENTTGPLAAEFARVLKEMQLGRSRGEALASLGDRSDAPEIKAFVSALTQADRLGVPIGGVLREQSEELRVRRRQRAEEAAQKVPIKILFPVLLCIFPVFFIIIIGPGAIRIAQAFSHG